MSKRFMAEPLHQLLLRAVSWHETPHIMQYEFSLRHGMVSCIGFTIGSRHRNALADGLLKSLPAATPPRSDAQKTHERPFLYGPVMLCHDS